MVHRLSRSSDYESALYTVRLYCIVCTINQVTKLYKRQSGRFTYRSSLCSLSVAAPNAPPCIYMAINTSYPLIMGVTWRGGVKGGTPPNCFRFAINYAVTKEGGAVGWRRRVMTHTSPIRGPRIAQSLSLKLYNSRVGVILSLNNVYEIVFVESIAARNLRERNLSQEQARSHEGGCPLNFRKSCNSCFFRWM